MSKKVKLTIHPKFQIGQIDPRLFSGYLEPMGNLINPSLYDPAHPTANAAGFRQDYIDVLKQSGLPAVRLPGGNFVSGWDWKDSIGPKEQRRKHLDLAWHQYYSNDVGHDEYLQWAEQSNFEPLYTINLGTGDINDAIYIAEYTNHEGGTYWSDLRRKNGHEKPYGVKMWYLGNEVDGPWQVGSWERDPRGYGVRANEVSKAMKWVDGSIETAACVSCSPCLNHYPDWDRQVLEQCYESVDYISLHHYQNVRPDHPTWMLGSAIYFEDYINTEIALCDYIQTKCRSPKKMMLSFDEYGVIPHPQAEKLYYGSGPHNIYRLFQDLSYRPYITGGFTFTGERFHHGELPAALCSASVIMTFLRHADRVKIGCMTGGLGALISCDKEHFWHSASYYTFSSFIKYAKGVSLRVGVDCDTFDIPGFAANDHDQYADRQGIPYIDAAAAYDELNGTVNLFVINRYADEDKTAEIDCTGFAGYRLVEHLQMHTDDLNDYNTWEEEKLNMKVNPETTFENGVVKTNLKAYSWNVFRFAK